MEENVVGVWDEGPVVTAWDAQAEIAVGEIIRRHLAAFPPPQDSLFAADLYSWSDRLLTTGREHLQELVAGGGAGLSVVR